jgi:hypothetical protein
VTATTTSRRATGPSISEDHKLLLACIAELFYRCKQVELYVAPIAARSEYVDVARTIVELISEAWRDTQAVLRQALEIRLPPSIRSELLFNVLRLIAKRFNRAHERLSVFPGVGVHPEASEMLARAFTPRSVPPILLTSLFNALEFNFAPEFLEGRKSVLQLAMCDFASPPSWAILGHEMGHALDNGQARDVADALVGRLRKPKAREVVRDLAEELFADLVATQVLGPAPMLAAIAMENCVFDERLGYWSPRGRAERIHRVHPLMTWRLRALRDAVTDRETSRILDQEVRKSERSTRYRLRLDVPSHEERKKYTRRDEMHFER